MKARTGDSFGTYAIKIKSELSPKLPAIEKYSKPAYWSVDNPQNFDY
ncbi:MAG: hypothetical protein HamCj_21400 [Candidatus Hamiltonella defensa (Ceratovacuna japonica)]